jgi:lantibiotic modifying enzyme
MNLNLLPVDGSGFDQLSISEPELPDNNDVVDNIPANNNENNDNQINVIKIIILNHNNNDDEGEVEDGPINDLNLEEDNTLESSVGVQAISNDEAQVIVEMI